MDAYRIVPDDGYKVDSVDPAFNFATNITKDFTQTINISKHFKATFNAGTAEEMAKGAAITSAKGK